MLIIQLCNTVYMQNNTVYARLAMFVAKPMRTLDTHWIRIEYHRIGECADSDLMGFFFQLGQGRGVPRDI